jgi:hypothetical protein
MPGNDNRPGAGHSGPINQSLAAGGMLASLNLPDGTDNRAALRTLLSRIDLGEPMRRRAVQQAISDALPETWRRRAELFDSAASRPGDHPGGAVDWESGRPLNLPVSDHGRDVDLRLTALACRFHAAAIEAGWFA